MMRGVSSPIFSNKKIIFATDFLESSRLALDYAIGFARHYDSTLFMVHAVELTQAALEVEMASGRASLLRRSAAERIAAMAAEVKKSGVSVEARLEEGNPCDVLLRAAQAGKADLLVLGPRGTHSGFDHLILGSDTEHILLSACCPTLTLGRHVQGRVELDLRFEEILYISDFTPAAAAAAPFALQLGHDFNTWVDVCQTMPSSAEYDRKLCEKLASEYCENMKSILPEGEHRWSSTAFQLNQTMTKEQILERTKSNSGGLIVLGAKKRSHLGRHLHTSFAYELLAQATCPILTIHCP